MASTWWLVAERDIEADEEITWTYTLYSIEKQDD
jgi:hypothetical protein